MAGLIKASSRTAFKLFSSTSTRSISSTATTFSVTQSPSPSPSPSPFPSSRPRHSVENAQRATLDVILRMTDSVAGSELPQGEDAGSLLKNIGREATISPYHLSPTHLLKPHLQRPDFTLAYPLGPPTSAAKSLDVFSRLELDPLDSPLNPYLRIEFCTAMGKIKSRGKTGLQRSNQRKMGKAVRRARSMGVVAVFGRSQPGTEQSHLRFG